VGAVGVLCTTVGAMAVRGDEEIEGKPGVGSVERMMWLMVSCALLCPYGCGSPFS